MQVTAYFGLLLLVGLATGAPTSNENKVVITEDFFPNKLVKYTANHDVVNIVYTYSMHVGDGRVEYLFFVEADNNAKGDREYKGLYVLKNGEAKKLLDNGRDATVVGYETRSVYFAASDGLYLYNAKKNEAVKYGTITDSIINIVNHIDTLYILTDDHIMYKVIEEGTKKVKVDKVVNAQQIVLDYKGTVYYYTPDKQVYLFANDEVKKIEGLPSKASYVRILKPPGGLENGVPVIVDNKAYVVYKNGTSEVTDVELHVKPTAYSMEGTPTEYFAYNKKIYEYIIDSTDVNSFSDQLKKYLGNVLLGQYLLRYSQQK